MKGQNVGLFLGAVFWGRTAGIPEAMLCRILIFMWFRGQRRRRDQAQAAECWGRSQLRTSAAPAKMVDWTVTPSTTQFQGQQADSVLRHDVKAHQFFCTSLHDIYAEYTHPHGPGRRRRDSWEGNVVRRLSCLFPDDFVSSSRERWFATGGCPDEKDVCMRVNGVTAHSARAWLGLANCNSRATGDVQWVIGGDPDEEKAGISGSSDASLRLLPPGRS